MFPKPYNEVPRKILIPRTTHKKITHAIIMKIMKNAAPKIDFDMCNDKRGKERILNKQVSSENRK